MWVSKLRSLRWVYLFLVIANAVVVILGVFLVFLAYPPCGRHRVLPYLVVTLASVVRVIAIIRAGIAQEAAAIMILASPDETTIVDAVIRQERRMKYKTWLWWTRFAMVITILQFVGATYLIFHVAKHTSNDGTSNDCVLGTVPKGYQWKKHIVVAYMILVCFVALVQCFTGSDVLRWRSFYATQDNAWKAHYREVFDRGIREALCCLGRFKYLSALEEDEVHSVARLLGDLVAYRASGTGHLELLAGLALLKTQSQLPKSYEGSLEASVERIQDAAVFHPFAEAAYTGLLLDFGRNPILFPCVWIYRQGFLSPWTRNRQPVLQGDNWWRGHAAAFLKYVRLSPEVLRLGRVCQAKCEAAYFVVVLHHLRSVVIAVRGTETPEDLITDGLCGECSLSVEDLDGLINSNQIHPNVRQSVISSFPHYGHSGIVEAARDLFNQVEGNAGAGDSSPKSSGFLSSLLQDGCECEGYNVRIVGHSLGGAIAALLGIRLYGRYPNLHVYSYGTLPCVDSVVADACSEFVTSIVYGNEFSARLSVGSILRLRGATLTALSEDTTTDTAVIFRLARRLLHLSRYRGSKNKEKGPGLDIHPGAVTAEGISHIHGSQHMNNTEGNRTQDRDTSLWIEADMKSSSDESDLGDSPDSFCNPFAEITADIIPSDDPVSEFMEAVPSSDNVSAGDPHDIFLPGLIIHIVPQQRSFHLPLWKGCRIQEKAPSYKAYISDRERFKDIIVSPSMFLDHLPWRCYYAMQKILGTEHAKNLLDESEIV
ncbi:hypothetical protein VitviT2T_007327 [Vitis vinifera]|uniref:Fungal lipase-like domain-containing protein n=1 Tax=Vitis vinifera TaxID=29760 RepID=A0ABY9BYH5_VITVI|nr:uncharacterized protein LOC100248021 isoform X1 [Vitis vinifera]XP_010650465.1 uncharacterized protein LOC100248021 isoform X1 [Vitis vinifera]WJZ87987.1 hypothetical protein VitviT2T_007327 [Vitis vinifera]|eukprot:XP_010650464.1 PREDICTED: uncharacterized protein LOC100248021 isoform X1 [Vitis vinifera]